LWLLGDHQLGGLYYLRLQLHEAEVPAGLAVFCGFSAFIVALFTEMYGVPVTIYLLAGWLQRRYPALNPLSHDTGHLWWTLAGQHGNPHLGVLHLLSCLLILGGFVLLSAAWPVLYTAQRQHQLATTGVYARIRHPQYVGFIAIMFGFLLQWPTTLTLIMFPLLVWMYVRLGRGEEGEALREFGPAYVRYAAATPRWIPHLHGAGDATAHPGV